MYTLIDTFNNVLISAHRTLEAAVKAEARHDRRVKRFNGVNSYIPTAILCDGQPVDADDVVRERYRNGVWR